MNVALLYNTFRVLSPVYHSLTLPKIQVDTERSSRNDAFDEPPILPPPPLAHRPREPLLPLFMNAKDSKLVSPLSLSEFSEVEHHSRNSSRSSADSTIHLLSIKRKPSRYHGMRVKQNKMPSLSQAILPATELNRQFESSDPQSAKGHSLYLDLPVAEVNAAKPTLETVSLSPAPRSAVASVHNPFPVAPTPAKSATASPIRQFTLAFGRPRRKSKFGPRSKGGAALPPALPVIPPLSPIPSVESPTNVSATSAARIRVSPASPTEEQRLPQLDLTGVTPTPPVRPLPAITAEVEVAQRVDKGKGRALTPPLPLPVKDDDTSGKSHSRNFLRPLPQFPRDSTRSSSSDESGRYPDPDPDSFLSLSPNSLQPDFKSNRSSNASLEAAHKKPLPILQTHDHTSDEEDSTDSEHSLSLSTDTHRRVLPSRRATRASVWSQESAMTQTHPPDMEVVLAGLLARA